MSRVSGSDLRRLWQSLRRNPFAVCSRIFSKLVTEPLRYRTNRGYDAATYWDDRLSAHGRANEGAGDHARAPQAVAAHREALLELMIDQCRNADLVPEEISMLDIGCGDGFYARGFSRYGIPNYHGVDITDALFDAHRQEFGRFRFTKLDVTEEPVPGEYDLVVMLYVIIHIVEREKLQRAMRHLAAAIKPGGIAIIAPVSGNSSRGLYYVHQWALSDLAPLFDSFSEVTPLPFGDEQILLVRK